jgi:hypothetical protein
MVVERSDCSMEEGECALMENQGECEREDRGSRVPVEATPKHAKCVVPPVACWPWSGRGGKLPLRR